MKDWERIRREREDITDYVIHFIRPKYGNEPQKPIDILKKIIKDGYLIPTFAIRSSIYDRSRRPTIKGPYPAVCLTEQSITNFAKSCNVLVSRYSPYGVAFPKKALFQYGGRPVIYHSEEILGSSVRPSEPDYQEGKEIFKNGLPKDFQYLWSRYQPIPNDDGYVVD